MRGITHCEELVLKGCHAGLSVLSHKTTGKLVHVNEAVAVGVGGIGAGIVLEALDSSVLLTIPYLGLTIQLCLILHETAVGWHVGEEYEWQTSGEETRTSTDLQTLITEDIVGETNTRRERDAVARPLACINMTTIVVEVVDGLVSQQVVVVEEESVNTQTVGQLEVVGDVEIILGIDAGAIELHTGSWLRLTVVTVSQTYDLRSSTVHEVVHRVVTVVTGTITHILVVSHLMLESETSHDLVLTHVISHVVLDVPNGVMNGVIPGEQLITEGHVVVVATIEDVDERELRRIGTADIIELRQCSQELVGEIIRQTAVQVDRPRMYEVVHRVHRVGKRHGVL